MTIHLNHENKEYLTVPNQDKLTNLYTSVRQIKKKIIDTPNGSYNLSLELQKKTKELNALLTNNRKLIRLVRSFSSNDNRIIKEMI